MKKEPFIIVDPAMEEYAGHHTTPESAILSELNRETYVKILNPRMLSGHVLGEVLKLFSRLIRPKQVLDIGTYTGYSAICLTTGLANGGMIHTVEINRELEEIIRRYFVKAGVEDKIRLYFGNALEVIPSIHEEFDLVFIDADKEHYLDYYKLVIDKVRKGGLIIADDALWDGKVLNPEDSETKGITRFNDFVQSDKRVENILLTVRHGLMVARKV
ncbi:MAG: O-methyltransferase [Bacteroidetes bacterium]|nr:O-methyltransferase [Bacteroidota bacterium]